MILAGNKSEDVISSNLNPPHKLLFLSTNNNLSLKICCKNILDVTFLIYLSTL